MRAKTNSVLSSEHTYDDIGGDMLENVSYQENNSEPT